MNIQTVKVNSSSFSAKVPASGQDTVKLNKQFIKRVVCNKVEK